MSSPAPLLLTRGLTMRFGGVLVLAGIDFAIKPRELRCVIGPNGAGKSTLFKCLTGQLVPTAGDILFNGVSIAGRSSAEIAQRGIGIKMQVPSLFGGLTVAHNIWLAASRSRRRDAAAITARELMARVKIMHLADVLVSRLAHGQRQLVELAVVAAGDPQLILLDEPAAGMTREEVDRLAKFIRELSDERAVIVVEHDMQFIRMIASTVTVLHRGKILIEDEVDRVMRDQSVRDVYLGRRMVTADVGG